MWLFKRRIAAELSELSVATLTPEIASEDMSVGRAMKRSMKADLGVQRLQAILALSFVNEIMA
jgi:hypothetical protein